MKVQVTLTTAPDRKVARRIARALVGEQLAACVNLIDGLESIYRWKGKVESAREVLLVIKSRASAAARLRRRIVELHPYDVPEVLHLPVNGGAAKYLAWIGASVRA
jgi:periplasmic divalent cation tolerance protein